jgi:hypothetical protein
MRLISWIQPRGSKTMSPPPASLYQRMLKGLFLKVCLGFLTCMKRRFHRSPPRCTIPQRSTHEKVPSRKLCIEKYQENLERKSKCRLHVVLKV